MLNRGLLCCGLIIDATLISRGENKTKIRTTFRLKNERSKSIRPWITVLWFNNRCNSDIEKGKQKGKATYRLKSKRSRKEGEQTTQTTLTSLKKSKR